MTDSPIAGTFRFAWHQENGDMPTSATKEGTLCDAVILALKDQGVLLYGLRGIRPELKPYRHRGNNGVTIVRPCRAPQLFRIGVSLNPVRSEAERRMGLHWQRASYTSCERSLEIVQEPENDADEAVPSFP
jgi:hypothetical protein